MHGCFAVQGNALGRGPLVLHLPMRLLATIKQRAAAALPASQQQEQQTSLLAPAGSAGPNSTYSDSGVGIAGGTASSLNAAAFAQLLLDMHRQAGVMLLDRMGSNVVLQLAVHVEMAVQVRQGSVWL